MDKVCIIDRLHMVSIIRRQSLCFKYDAFQVITQTISYFLKEVLKYLNVIDSFFQTAIVSVIKYFY